MTIMHRSSNMALSFLAFLAYISVAVNAIPLSSPLTESTLFKPRAVYGSVVDTVDAPLPTSTVPHALPNRNNGADTSFTVGGSYSTPFPGSIGGDYLTFFTGQNVSLTGTGYFLLRWEVAYFNVPGLIVPPVWTGLTGKFFHVASGGGRRMDDQKPAGYWTGCTGGEWMGCPNESPPDLDTLPSGMQQMWQNEYYFLDGSVTLHDTEDGVDYNLGITPYTWQEIHDEVNGPPDPKNGIVRYGLVRDTGDDSCPVPQYLTCECITDLTALRAVPQVSEVKQCAGGHGPMSE